MRIHYHKIYNNFASISLNNKTLFYIIIINFIINILLTKNFYIKITNDIILIMINKFTKHATYIIIQKNLNVEKLIKIM